MTGPRRHCAILLCLAAALILMLAGPAAARNKRKPGIYVHPGPGAIAKAIARAKQGQTIRIRRGRYHEALVIDKPVRLIAAGRVRPVIDGDCGTRFTIAVSSPGVILRRLKVVGADEDHGPFPAEVDFRGVSSGRAQGLVVRDTCDAEYGINVYDTGPVQILANQARGGFSDAGIYIGGITDTGLGTLRVKGNLSYGNNRGVIVEDTLASTDVRVTSNQLFDNAIPPGEGEPSGLFLHRSDGILIFGNGVYDNGALGIDLDGESDHNLLIENVLSGNPTNYRDLSGDHNCGSGNSGASIPAC
jgi:parallel beta-helix repeat protein